MVQEPCGIVSNSVPVLPSEVSSCCHLSDKQDIRVYNKPFVKVAPWDQPSGVAKSAELPIPKE